jgi:hypothetical protein
VAELLSKVAGYLPGWQPEKRQPAHAVLEVASRYLQRLDLSYREALDRTQLTFLDAVGERRLPAQAATVPVVFKLVDDATADMSVPEGAQIQATPIGQQASDVPPVFSTAQSFTITRAVIARAYTVLPLQDQYAEHTSNLTTGFVAFEADDPIEHAIYLGDELFNLPAAGCGGGDSDASDDEPETRLHLKFDFRKILEDEIPLLQVQWEFYGETGWLPLEEVSGGAARPKGSLFGEELVILKKPFGPASKKMQKGDNKTYWVRGKLSQPLPVKGTDGRGGLPVVDRVFTTVVSALSGLYLDEAIGVGRSLDISQPFFPFDRLPRTHDVFYFTCREAFQRNHASVRIRIEGNINLYTGQPVVPHENAPTLVWEYFNGKTWSSFSISVLQKDSAVIYSFIRPHDWQETDVQGSSNYWLRIRISEGDFGHPLSLEWDSAEVVATVDSTTTVTTDPDETTVSTSADIPLPQPIRSTTLNAPVINSIVLSYSHASPTQPVRYGVVSNDFREQDVTSRLAFPGRSFEPFRREGLTEQALYFAFDKLLPSGLVSFYVHVQSQEQHEQQQLKSRYIWEYWSQQGWRDLSVRDDTNSLQQSGTLQFVGPWDAAVYVGFGGDLYRIRARLKEDMSVDPVPIAGIWLNAVMASEERYYPRVPLGTSNGDFAQLFQLASAQLPVLAGQKLEVREWSRATGGAPPFIEDLPEGRFRVIEQSAFSAQNSGEKVDGLLPGFVKNIQANLPQEIWIEWQQRETLMSSGAQDRHYTLDRTSGTVRFGDGVYGRIPPAGSSLVMSYYTGGGVSGNLPQGVVRQSLAVIPALESVYNPLPAFGGAPAEALADTRSRGAQRLRHGDRAITETDYEWLAREASPAVLRARCLPLTGAGGGGQRGWVSLIIIPHSTAPQPQPDAELRRRVRNYISARAPAPVAHRIRVVAPQYCAINVIATILPDPDADLTLLESQLRTLLNNYLHPLTGGPDVHGWRMGQKIYLSQIAQQIENTSGIDRALKLRLHIDGHEQGQVAMLPANALPASGAHELSFRFEEAS